MDLNDFKGINDTYGHDEGDNLLKIFADVLVSTLGKEAFVGRVGGDEFVAVLSGEDLENVEKLLEQFYQKMKEQQIISIAAGFAAFDKKTDKEIQDVFKRADAIMYQNKEDIKKGSATHFPKN